MKNNFPTICVCLLIVLGCTHKPFTTQTIIPFAPAGCDTTNVSYKTVIKPLLNNNCYQCHATAVTVNGGLDLEDFTSLKNYLFLGFRGDGIYGSKFYHTILHSLNALPMPPLYKLDTCSLKQVKGWLELGAPDN